MAAPSGPVMVQESVSAPAVQMSSPDRADTAATGATAPRKEEEEEEEEDDDDDNQSVWEDETLYEQILDESEVVEFSTDGKICWVTEDKCAGAND
jgi:outer membrane protein OmpA-like peptidoglycan-associated protein